MGRAASKPDGGEEEVQNGANDVCSCFCVPNCVERLFSLPLYSMQAQLEELRSALEPVSQELEQVRIPSHPSPRNRNEIDLQEEERNKTTIRLE